jgi:hypothetical protein
MANGIVNGIANDIVNAINNFIARSKADSPVHVEINDVANAIDNDRVKRIVKVKLRYIHCKANGKVNSICYAFGDAKVNVGSNAFFCAWTVIAICISLDIVIGNRIVRNNSMPNDIVNANTNIIMPESYAGLKKLI